MVKKAESMTLKTIINKLQEYALGTPNVGGVIVNDVYHTNFWEGIEYAIVAIIQREHAVSDNLATYRFQLAYIDRLNEDRSNDVDIQSDGVMVISNVVNALIELNDNVELSGEITFSVFNERFKDECSGVVADVSLITASPMGTCHDVAYLRVIPSEVKLNADGDSVAVEVKSNVKWTIYDE